MGHLNLRLNRQGLDLRYYSLDVGLSDGNSADMSGHLLDGGLGDGHVVSWSLDYLTDSRDSQLLDSQLLDSRANSGENLLSDGFSDVLLALALSVGDNGVDVLNNGVDLLGHLSVGLDDFSDLLDNGFDDLMLDS